MKNISVTFKNKIKNLTLLLGVTLFSFVVGNFIADQLFNNNSKSKNKVELIKWLQSSPVVNNISNCSIQGSKTVLYLGRSTGNFSMDFDRKYDYENGIANELSKKLLDKYCFINLNTTLNTSFEDTELIVKSVLEKKVVPQVIIFENLKYLESEPFGLNSIIKFPYYVKQKMVNLLKKFETSYDNNNFKNKDYIKLNSNVETSELLELISWKVEDEKPISNEEFYDLVKSIKNSSDALQLFQELGGVYYNAKSISPNFVNDAGVDFYKDWSLNALSEINSDTARSIVVNVNRIIENDERLKDSKIVLVPHMLRPFNNASVDFIKNNYHFKIVGLDYFQQLAENEMSFLNIFRDGRHYNQNVCKKYVEKILINVN